MGLSPLVGVQFVVGVLFDVGMLTDGRNKTDNRYIYDIDEYHYRCLLGLLYVLLGFGFGLLCS